MRVAASLVGASRASAITVDGLLLFPGALPGAALVQRPHTDGAEDWLLFPTAPSTREVKYDVTLTRGVSALRLVENTLEFLDAGGAPRLRMAPPHLVDADCRVHPVSVSVQGCAVRRRQKRRSMIGPPIRGPT